MRLREYVELQAKNTKSLNEWRISGSINDDGRVVKTRYETLKPQDINYTNLKFYQAYDLYLKVGKPWLIKDVEAAMGPKFFIGSEDLYDNVREYLSVTKGEDLNKKRTVADVTKLITEGIEEMVKNSPDTVFNIHSESNPDHGPVDIYIGYHPVIGHLVCMRLLRDYRYAIYDAIDVVDYRNLFESYLDYLEWRVEHLTDTGSISPNDPAPFTIDEALDELRND